MDTEIRLQLLAKHGDTGIRGDNSVESITPLPRSQGGVCSETSSPCERDCSRLNGNSRLAVVLDRQLTDGQGARQASRKRRTRGRVAPVISEVSEPALLGVQGQLRTSDTRPSRRTRPFPTSELCHTRPPQLQHTPHQFPLSYITNQKRNHTRCA